LPVSSPIPQSTGDRAFLFFATLSHVAISIVSFHRGEHDWLHVTDGHSTHEVVRNAMRFFADPFWKGPKPKPDEVYTVAIVGDERRWRVRGDRVCNNRSYKPLAD